MSAGGQEMMNSIGEGKPIVAAIQGSCLGGGLELAMACHYRIASEDPKTTMALPEVMLGLLPGAGGTQRLPKLVGMQDALPLMLTGKNIKPKKAKSLKLVDGVADPSALEHAAVLAARSLADGTLKIDRSPKGLKKFIRNTLETRQYGINFLFKKATEGVMKQTGGKYPAPLKIIEAARAGLERGFVRGSEIEAKNFGELGMTPESKALISIFYAQTASKKNRFGTPAKPVNTIAVLGAGLMGAGICQVSMEKKFNVIVKDMNLKALARGEQQIYNNIMKKRSLDSFSKQQTYSRLTGILDSHPHQAQVLNRADLVLEAVFEDMDVKHKVIKDLEDRKLIRDDAIIATNTSSLEVGGIAKASKHPERVVGMHYFSPVDKMPLLEIIPHAGTSKETSSAAVDAGIRQGKTVIVVKDVPGFFVNRCLGPYMAETMALIKDGVAPQRLDKCLRSFGMPVGPVALCDEVGADIALHVQQDLAKALGTRMLGADAQVLQGMVDQNMMGRKSGKGFFMYDKGKGGKIVNPEIEPLVEKLRAGKEPVKLSDEDVALRMMVRFANEAAFCLQDGIIENAVDGDIGAIFGVGFPPFLGGPFRWMDAMGAQKFVDLMHRFAETNGKQFEPCQLIVDLAKAGTKFHKN